jgi:hypothetical protein
MGVAASTVENSTVTQIINDVINKYVSNASMEATQDQLIEIQSKGPVHLSGIKMTQHMNVNFEALMSNQITNQMQLDLIKTLKADADSKAGALGMFSGSVSVALNKSANKIQNNLSTQNIQSCVSNVAQSQAIKIASDQWVVVDNVDMSQTSELITKCVMESVGLNYTDQKVREEYETSAISRVEGLFETIPGGMYTMACICCISCLASLLIPLFTGSQNKEETVNEQPIESEMGPELEQGVQLGGFLKKELTVLMMNKQFWMFLLIMIILYAICKKKKENNLSF